MNILDLLKGISGTYEINRVVGAFGATAYVIGAHIFIAWSIHDGRPFSLTEYCIAFPGGLAVVVGAIAGAVSVKDRNVATSTVIQNTGAQPGAAPVAAPTQRATT